MMLFVKFASRSHSFNTDITKVNLNKIVFLGDWSRSSDIRLHMQKFNYETVVKYVTDEAEGNTVQKKNIHHEYNVKRAR